MDGANEETLSNPSRLGVISRIRWYSPRGLNPVKMVSLLTCKTEHRELVTKKEGGFLLVTTLRRENQAILIEYKVY